MLSLNFLAVRRVLHVSKFARYKCDLQPDDEKSVVKNLSIFKYEKRAVKRWCCSSTVFFFVRFSVFGKIFRKILKKKKRPVFRWAEKKFNRLIPDYNTNSSNVFKNRFFFTFYRFFTFLILRNV